MTNVINKSEQKFEAYKCNIEEYTYHGFGFHKLIFCPTWMPWLTYHDSSLKNKHAALQIKYKIWTYKYSVLIYDVGSNNNIVYMYKGKYLSPRSTWNT